MLALAGRVFVVAAALVILLLALAGVAALAGMLDQEERPLS